MGKKIRLLALDLDGTLLNGAKQITPRTQAALERARQQGVLMVPVTGRPAQGLPPAVLSLPGLRYAVTSNGATIRDLVEQRVLLEKHLAPALCLQVLARCAHIPMIRQVFRAASYHDVGRTFDGYDIYHGARSALRLAALTGQTGEALVELQAAVTAHSRPDREMASIVASFQPRDLPHAMALTRLLKDADNLDRVRLGDLDPKFLRHDSAKDLVGFAQHLFQRDQAAREP